MSKKIWGILLFCSMLCASMVINNAVNAQEAKIANTSSPAHNTVAIHPIIGCLKIAEGEIGKDRKWGYINTTQKTFLGLFEKAQTDLDKFSSQELESVCSKDTEKVNQWLRKKGFPNTQLPPTDNLSMASVMKVAVKWQFVGKKRDFVDEEKRVFVGVEMAAGFEVFRVKNHKYAVIHLRTTREGEDVFLSIFDPQDVPADDFALAAKMESVVDGERKSEEDIYKLIFPMVKMSQEKKLDWILGLNTTDTKGQRMVLSQAVQETRFQMDEKGVKVESAAAIIVSRGMEVERKIIYVVDRPFIVMIRRKGLSAPIFVGYIPKTDWENPNAR